MAIITTAGLESIGNNGYGDFTHLALGTGSQQESLTLTALANEIDRVSVINVSVSGGVALIEALLTSADAIGDITEYGVFDAATGGNLLLYGKWATPQAKTSAQGGIMIITVTMENA